VSGRADSGQREQGEVRSEYPIWGQLRVGMEMIETYRLQGA